MPLARIHSMLLHFVHIPKTGGACITSYLRAKGKLALYSYQPLAWSRSTPQHIDHQVAKVLLPPGFADIAFAVVRDPMDRMLSEFRYRATRQAEVPGAVGPSADGRITVQLNWDDRFCGTFDEWVDFVFAGYAEDPYIYDNHIRPQVEFITEDVKLFRFEQGLDQVLRWIDRVTGTPPMEAPLDRNQSAQFPIEMSGRTRAAIRDFYVVDYALINALNARGGR